MVWGMTLPQGFGEFWPLGDFEGWRQRLNGFYASQTPEAKKALYEPRGEVSYAYYVNRKFSNEPETGGGQYEPPLSRIKSHEPPEMFVTEKTYKTLGSLMLLNDSILAVDERFRGIVDRLEPGVHEFFPIEIVMPKGGIYPDKYFTLVIGQYFDAFSREETQAGSVQEYPSGVVQPDTSKAGVNGIAVRRSVYRGADLWRDRRLGAELTCFSDELQAEVSKANLRIPKHYRMMEV